MNSPTNRQMRAGTESCFLCGLPGATTVEHVVPRSFYPNGLINDPPRAPAHDACNKTTVKAEDGFRTLITIATAPDDGERPLFDRTMRALLRPEAAGFRADFESRMRRLPNGGMIGTRLEHVLYTLAKICKGLAYLESGLIVRPNSVRWAARLIPIDRFLELNLPTPQFEARVPTVLEAAWFTFPQLPLHAYVRFYGQPIYSLTALPSSSVLTAKQWDARWLPWPGGKRNTSLPPSP